MTSQAPDDEIDGSRDRTDHRAAARARERFLAALAVGIPLEIADDALALDGVVWDGLGAAFALVFTVLFVLWVRLAFRAAGGVRTWLQPVLMAAGVAVGIILVARAFV